MIRRLLIKLEPECISAASLDEAAKGRLFSPEAFAPGHSLASPPEAS